jgi:GMP synthase (glutamine-hydrolysing) A subunit
MTHDTILILDFGSQVTQLIARRVREAHVFCEVHPCDVSEAWLRDYAASGKLKGIILSGSHASAYEEETDKAPQTVFELGIPVLGICYGMQTMAQQLGGQVQSGSTREFGYAEVRAHGHTALLQGIEDFATPEGHGMLKVWMSHGDKVTAMPAGFKLMASTPSCPIAGMADEARRFYGLQFHPEVTHTVQGQALLNRFVLDICQARADWVMGDYVQEAVEAIRRQVGDEEVILGLSGGVDSSVALKFTCADFELFSGGDLTGETVERSFGLRREGYHDVESSTAPRVGDVEVYRADHHGSGHSSNPCLVSTLRPEVSIISSGENTYGHPDLRVVQALRPHGLVFITSGADARVRAEVAGEIVGGDVEVDVSADGRRYTVNGWGFRSKSETEEAASPPAACAAGDWRGAP